MNKKALATAMVVMGLFPSLLFGQLYRMDVDVQDAGVQKVIDRVFTGNTVGLDVGFYDGGYPLVVTNWTMLFRYYDSQYSTNPPTQIVGVASSNRVSFDSTTNLFYSANENYYFSISGVDNLGHKRTFARGRMIEEYDPATAGSGGVSSNGVYFISWGNIYGDPASNSNLVDFVEGYAGADSVARVIATWASNAAAWSSNNFSTVWARGESVTGAVDSTARSNAAANAASIVAVGTLASNAVQASAKNGGFSVSDIDEIFGNDRGTGGPAEEISIVARPIGGVKGNIYLGGNVLASNDVKVLGTLSATSFSKNVEFSGQINVKRTNHTAAAADVTMRIWNGGNAEIDFDTRSELWPSMSFETEGEYLYYTADVYGDLWLTRGVYTGQTDEARATIHANLEAGGVQMQTGIVAVAFNGTTNAPNAQGVIDLGTSAAQTCEIYPQTISFADGYASFHSTGLWIQAHAAAQTETCRFVRAAASLTNAASLVCLLAANGQIVYFQTNNLLGFTTNGIFASGATNTIFLDSAAGSTNWNWKLLH